MVKKVYFALLHPHIQYCKTSWGCAAKSALDSSEACGQTSEAYGTYYDV